MIRIDKDHIYTKGKYSFRNFISLSEEEKKMVLEWRNHINIRKWMYSDEPIEIKQHMDFIKSLNQREDCFYWLVSKEEKNIGVFSITKIDYENSNVESGYYLDPYNEEGDGFLFIHALYQLMFEDLNVVSISGSMLATNKYAVLNALFLGFVINSEKVLGGKVFVCGEIKKTDYFNNFEKKTETKEFFKFIQQNKTLLKAYKNKQYPN